MKTVIFDFDGVLADSEKIFYKIFEEMTKEYDQEHIYNHEYYTKNMAGRSGRVNITNLIKTFSLPYDVDTGIAIKDQLMNTYVERGIDLMPGAKELISYLKENNYKIALATSSVGNRSIRILKYHHILDQFDTLTFGDEIEHGKPAPDIFVKAASKLGSDVKECIVIEDSRSGVEAGYNAHMKVFWMFYEDLPDEATKAKASKIFKNLYEVIDELKKGE